jgi:hypothetical protein
MELMQHQLDAVEKLSNGKILYGNVGSGKSIAILAYYMKHHSDKDIYVMTTAKKRDDLDWEGEAVKFGIGTVCGATLAGTITVDSWNNIKKYVDIEDAFFIFDEQRVVGSGAWSHSFIKIAAKNHWNLLSGTPGDSWMDYVPVFIANGFYKNRTQFINEHVVYAPFSKYPRIVRYLDVKTLEKWRNLVLVEMPYIKHTTRHLEYVPVAHDPDMFQRAYKDRWNVFEDEPIKDIAELFRVMRRIVNSDPSRLEKTRELLQKHDRIIIFYNFNYELEMLRRLVGDVEVGEWNGHRKTPIPDSDRWVYLVQYVAGAEGWNCVSTNAMIFWSMTYSYKNFEQAQGRIDRLNTDFLDLWYYVFVSDSLVDKAIKKSLDGKEHFNERKYVENWANWD